MTEPTLPSFTPIFDGIARELGVVTAAVYGRIWRYCQGDSGRCTAAATTIGTYLGLTERCVRGQAQLLVTAGYLVVVSREAGRPVVYALPTPERDSGLPRNGVPGYDEPRNGVPAPPEPRSDPPERDSGLPRNGVPAKRVSKKAGKRGKKRVRPPGATAPPADPVGPATASPPPAVALYHAKMFLWPPRKQRDQDGQVHDWREEIAASVGADPADLALWGEVLDWWLQRKYNPTNVGGLINRFQIEQASGKQTDHRTSTATLDLSGPDLCQRMRPGPEPPNLRPVCRLEYDHAGPHHGTYRGTEVTWEDRS